MVLPSFLTLSTVMLPLLIPPPTVLLDVHANMVLDVLELALPADAVAEEPREY